MMERTEKSIIAYVIIFLEIAPDWTLRIGPTLSLLSVPLSVSPKSFAKFEVIWNKSVVQMAPKKRPKSHWPLIFANARPSKIPEIDKGSVRNLNALIQAFSKINFR